MKDYSTPELYLYSKNSIIAALDIMDRFIIFDLFDRLNSLLTR